MMTEMAHVLSRLNAANLCEEVMSMVLVENSEHHILQALVSLPSNEAAPPAVPMMEGMEG